MHAEMTPGTTCAGAHGTLGKTGRGAARRAVLAIATALAATAGAGDAAAQATLRFHDAQGRYLGRAESSGGVTRFHDAQGRYRGQARTDPGPASAGRSLYDAQGRYRGRVQATGR